ncbi:type I-E CRISPR-associated protein Cse1/CasA [Lacticaseibacillus absianus]|uniref:type I-E CRISPR-associated protein Cse1/CasA n=1 Tax=Lacticaseibacillus absianus TaxID=2729623 RepID=UPI0015CE5358|nr:type I-E CRISPR-associated protein Cse1/CasA [Lacticaseibacillus absianus]
MDNLQFNLVTDPWIKVITKAGDTVETVSILTLFTHVGAYRRLAGEMRAQDLAILRLLLAIVQTVYSRYDEADQPYEWLQVDAETMQPLAVAQDDYDEDDLMATWQALKDNGEFTDRIVQYLRRYQDRFDFFGPQPFYQVTAAQYDQLVPADKQISMGKGTVDVKQIDRRISESGNSRAVFAAKTEAYKQVLALDELVRWLITYHQFTGVTDKTKIKTAEKFSVSMGWTYRLNPVFISGRDLFETLMLNLVLVPAETTAYHIQRPQWEFPDQVAYVDWIKKQLLPDNVAALYTMWSRILHIEWSDAGTPMIFSGGLPGVDATNAFVEPMTVWKWADKDKPPVFKPARKSVASLNKAMWRNFGQYVAVQGEQTDQKVHEPGVVSWLHKLVNEDRLTAQNAVHLTGITLISDGNATSQAPVAEVADEMTIQAAVLFDPDGGADYWPARIERAIDRTQQVGTDYYHFVKEVATIRGIDGTEFANRQSARFYAQLNAPFKQWLAGLSNQDDRDEKLALWKAELRRVVNAALAEVMQQTSSRDIRGITVGQDQGKARYTNIVLAERRVRASVKRHLAESGR